MIYLYVVLFVLSAFLMYLPNLTLVDACQMSSYVAPPGFFVLFIILFFLNSVLL